MKAVPLASVVCPDHQAQAAIRWPATGNLRALADTCDSCATGLDAALRQDHGDGVVIRSLPDIDDTDRDRLTAVHEAAHTVVAVATGQRVNWVRLHDADTPGAADGTTNLDTNGVPPADHLAMVWAGQEASVRWLAENGQDTPANRMGVRYLAWQDTADATDIAAECGLADDAGVAECEALLDARWLQVRHVAAQLLERRELTGDDVHTLLADTPATDAKTAADDTDEF